MARKKRRGRGQWEEIIGEQERSGLSAKDFCQAKSIGLANFYAWRRRFRDTDAGSGGGIEAKGTFIDMVTDQRSPGDNTQMIGETPAGAPIWQY